MFRLLYWANAVFAVALIPYFAMTDGANDSTIVLLVFVVICAAQFARRAAQRVYSKGESLIVRNPWRTHRIHAKEVQRFVVARERTWVKRSGLLVIVCELKRGGSIELSATRTAGLRKYDAASEPLALTIEDLLAWKRSVQHAARHAT